MKKNLEILEIEAKLTKDEKKYWRVKTGQGWMSVFDVVAKDAIKETHNHSDNGMVCCEVIEKKGTDFKGEEKIFYNITKCYGEAQNLGDTSDGEAHDEKPEVVKMNDPSGRIFNGEKPKTNDVQVGVYTSYAKDIFVALRIEDKNVGEEITMKYAIDLVKQAKEAFE
ncbi:hypothetical protein LCGC14_3047770 [marine sediment metagenome]|uniref:Uncharacterized protein n=1 Tax=marine sediment metagenome TaxID=412755 RepID=A0A0F8YVJ4_9ZZZZ